MIFVVLVLYLWFSDAKETSNFTCQPGNKEGQIICDVERKPHHACFTYQLSVSPDHQFVPSESSNNEIIAHGLKPGLTYSISIVSVTSNGSSTSYRTTNATASKLSSSDFLLLGDIFEVLHRIQVHVGKCNFEKMSKSDL